jgi:hypothetical protein
LKSDLGAENYNVEFYNSSGQLIQKYSGLKTNSEYPIDERIEGLVLYRVIVRDSNSILSVRVIAGN